MCANLPVKHQYQHALTSPIWLGELKAVYDERSDVINRMHRDWHAEMPGNGAALYYLHNSLPVKNFNIEVIEQGL
jgi:hypothetical protein